MTAADRHLTKGSLVSKRVAILEEDDGNVEGDTAVEGREVARGAEGQVTLAASFGERHLVTATDHGARLVGSRIDCAVIQGLLDQAWIARRAQAEPTRDVRAKPCRAACGRRVHERREDDSGEQGDQSQGPPPPPRGALAGAIAKLDLLRDHRAGPERAIGADDFRGARAIPTRTVGMVLLHQGLEGGVNSAPVRSGLEAQNCQIA